MEQFIKLPDGRIVIRKTIPERVEDSEPIDVAIMEIEVKQLHDRANVLNNSVNKLMLEAEQKQLIIDEIKEAKGNSLISVEDGNVSVEDVPANEMPDVKPIEVPIKYPVEPIEEEINP